MRPAARTARRAPPSRAAATGWRLAAAGGAAGAFTNVLLFPLDTAKTLRQADPARFSGALPALRAVLATRGIAGVYAGIAPALFGSALSSALYFSTYEFVRRRVAERQAAKRWRAPINALAAACGNVASSILFVPKEVVKQRMQAAADVNSVRFVGAAVNLVQTDGFVGLYRGYKATLLRNIPSTMLRFVLYEEAKLALMHLHARRRHATQQPVNKAALPSPLSPLEHLGAGAVSGAIASAITTPMDVIKTRFATARVAPGAGIVRVASDIVKERGVAGLYVGIRPRVLWSALFAAIGFSSYELAKQVFANPQTAMSLTKPSQQSSSRR
jgi:solute carrier family 25 (mitochondrial S-adenosylmethionine transporter), member 26